MKFFLPTLAFATSFVSSACAVSLYLVGDSTMASHAASEGIEGWGTQIGQYLTIPVVNKAVSGRSARSYWREGKWTAVQNLLKSGDIVVIEFGHNDGGSPTSSDRAEVGGEGTNTQTVTLADGTTEVVQTFTTYFKWMIDGAKSKGATVIISSQTPNNPYEGTTTITNNPTRFVPYAKNVAAAKGVPYVDHFQAAILYYTKLGKSVTESYFPKDHTHTNTVGANSVAWAFLSGAQCPSALKTLDPYLNDSGKGAGARC